MENAVHITNEEAQVLLACTPNEWLGIKEACFATVSTRLHVYMCMGLLCDNAFAESRDTGKQGVEIKLTELGVQVYTAFASHKARAH